MITHLLYRSFSTATLKDKQLQLILEKSQANNAKNDVTGILLYRNNTFLQLLEGPEKQVLTCMQRIRKDPRHHTAAVIFLDSSDQRIFPNWTMGHVPEKIILKPLEKINFVMTECMNLSLPPRGVLLAIIKSFVDPEYLNFGE